MATDGGNAGRMPHQMPDAQLETLREQYAERGIRAWLLAPDIPTYLALMNGEKVPVERLRPEALARYGLKR